MTKLVTPPIAAYHAGMSNMVDRADYVREVNTELVGGPSSLVRIEGGDANIYLRDARTARFVC